MQKNHIDTLTDINDVIKFLKKTYEAVSKNITKVCWMDAFDAFNGKPPKNVQNFANDLMAKYSKEFNYEMKSKLELNTCRIGLIQKWYGSSNEESDEDSDEDSVETNGFEKFDNVSASIEEFFKQYYADNISESQIQRITTDLTETDGSYRDLYTLNKFLLELRNMNNYLMYLSGEMKELQQMIKK